MHTRSHALFCLMRGQTSWIIKRSRSCNFSLRCSIGNFYQSRPNKKEITKRFTIANYRNKVCKKITASFVWFNSSPPGQNGRYFGRRHFQIHFLVELRFKFHWNISLGVQMTAGPHRFRYNGLVPNRRQAITWSYGDPVRRPIYAALGGGELNLYLIQL